MIIIYFIEMKIFCHPFRISYDLNRIVFCIVKIQQKNKKENLRILFSLLCILSYKNIFPTGSGVDFCEALCQ